ncbi:hypothetical protein IWW36_001583 [Coemansia brasiliensis]|uniref:Probable RNA polymerase II nuclear localization protein SLC7A6OS n=1 Tax=Coemansia brasiliensis TaxID=2650707 RepID=A0A9W8LYY4_9FUNG|nr:hypothetical protein IWW36_001583 [Coemansia brasiliensis]
MLSQTPNLQDNGDITVLRIKRKRDQEPLEALVIHQQQQQQRRKIFKGLTEHGSTDSLASEWEKTKPTLFAFGETISEADFSDAAKRRALQTRLAQLAKSKQEGTIMENSNKQTSTSASPASTSDSRQNTFRVVSRREMYLEDDMLQTPASSRNRIPEVVPVAELYKEKQRVKMLDAVHTEEFDTTARTSEPDPYAEVALGPVKDSKVAALDPRTVDELVPMVKDYLSFGPKQAEYVYDFYYIQKTYAGVDPNVFPAANVGSVLWIDDVNEFLADSSSEFSDDDEDSNAEDFYRNDYPDEPDSDMGMYYTSDEREAMRVDAYDEEYDDEMW